VSSAGVVAEQVAAWRRRLWSSEPPPPCSWPRQPPSTPPSTSPDSSPGEEAPSTSSSASPRARPTGSSSSHRCYCSLARRRRWTRSSPRLSSSSHCKPLQGPQECSQRDPASCSGSLRSSGSQDMVLLLAHHLRVYRSHDDDAGLHCRHVCVLLLGLAFKFS
jgi:hypothetical protein